MQTLQLSGKAHGLHYLDHCSTLTLIYSNHETNLVGEIMGGLVLHWPPLLILKAMSLAAKQGRALS